MRQAGDLIIWFNSEMHLKSSATIIWIWQANWEFLSSRGRINISLDEIASFDQALHLHSTNADSTTTGSGHANEEARSNPQGIDREPKRPIRIKPETFWLRSILLLDLELCWQQIYGRKMAWSTALVGRFLILFGRRMQEHRALRARKGYCLRPLLTMKGFRLLPVKYIGIGKLIICLEVRT